MGANRDNESDSDRGYNGSTLRWYLNLASKTPLIEREKEVELAVRIKNGDESAYIEFVASNTLLVVKIARDYPTSTTLELNDLISAGNSGLMVAARKYDPVRYKHVKFSTYAAWWIKQAIRLELSRRSRTIRIPTYRGQNIRNLNKSIERLSIKLEREPTLEEISDALSLEPEKVEDLLSETGTSSLDFMLSDDGESFSNVVPDENVADPYETCVKSDYIELIAKYIDELSRRQRIIIKSRFGIGCDEMTLEEVGKKFRLTRERIRQIEASALQKLGVLMGIRKRQSVARKTTCKERNDEEVKEVVV